MIKCRQVLHVTNYNKSKYDELSFIHEFIHLPHVEQLLSQTIWGLQKSGTHRLTLNDITPRKDNETDSSVKNTQESTGRAQVG